MAQTETTTVSQPVKQSGLDFKPFKLAIAAQFDRMVKLSNNQLFRTDVSKDWLWQTYINAFPAGSNPMFKERTEHDCNACKSFIRTVGNVVAIVDGQLQSIWDIADVTGVDPAYQTVASAMAEMVKAMPIANVFVHTEPVAGVDKNFGQLVSGDPVQYNHFFVNIPRPFVVGNDDIGPKMSDTRATHDVMLRSLTELTADAVETVQDLILQNSLYRGEENKFAVDSFRALKTEFNQAPNKDVFVWSKVASVPRSVSRIRNTAIGTLLTELSEGEDLEVAVKRFEDKVSGTNYKRPTALITPRMIEAAKAKIEELGLMSALERRYATITDITVNNILWADRSAKSAMTGDVFDQLKATAPEKVKNLDRVEEVTIDKFLSDILPTATSVEVMVENKHTANLMSLIAPVNPTAGQLFKWDNNFSWTYAGDVADSIKERVKAAGGNVSGDLCCRLAWSNFDDLDLHMVEPDGTHISFASKVSRRTGGQLDVDMNAGGRMSREPVENIFYPDRNKMPEGTYKLYVNQYNKRETTDVGFEAQIDFLGTVYSFSYPKPVTGNVTVAEFRYTKANGVEILNGLPSTQTSKDIWGVATQNFQKVNVVMFSPNHWDGQGVGNRHYFFILDGAKQDGAARGFYNEFLKSELDAHRKTFEVLGAKMKAEPSDNQLSGLGFSSTQRNELVVRVKGSFTRTIKVTF